MPFQTQGRGRLFFPDGTKIEAMRTGSAVWLDVGCISGDATAVYNYDENRIQLGNCAEPKVQIKNMTMAGDFELVDLDPESIYELSGGAFEYTDVTGATISGIDNQVATSGNWADVQNIPLVLTETATGLTHKSATVPVITSVTGSVDGALTVNVDFTLVVDSNTKSGYSILPNTAGANLTTIVQDLTIVIASFDPIISKILSAGSSTEILDPFQMRFTHTDDDGKIRRLELFRVDINSGGFSFGFKGQNADGLESMAIAFTARADSALQAKRQLMQWTVEENAQ